MDCEHVLGPDCCAVLQLRRSSQACSSRSCRQMQGRPP